LLLLALVDSLGSPALAPARPWPCASRHGFRASLPALPVAPAPCASPAASGIASWPSSLAFLLRRYRIRRRAKTDPLGRGSGASLHGPGDPEQWSPLPLGGSCRSGDRAQARIPARPTSQRA